MESWLDIFPQTPINETRQKQLRATWQYARERSPYYSKLLPEIEPQALRFMHLLELPITTKKELSEFQEEFRCSTEIPAYMFFTGGSTGVPTVLCGSESELEMMQSSLPPHTPGQKRPLTMMTGGGTHGYVPLVPGRKGCIMIPLRSRHNYELAWRLLSAEHHFEGYESKITRAQLPLPAVKKLVHYLLEEKYDLSLLALDYVGTFAWHLSDDWRYLISSVLGAVVIDLYGFTEIRTARAFECNGCGYYHLGANVIWEVVDQWTRRHITDGVGQLLVSSLLPECQEMVLFRFDSGDLVKLGPYCPEFGDRGFRHMGRQSQTFAVREGDDWTYAIFPTHIQEAVDLDQRVARFSNLRHGGVTKSEDDSFPKWRVRETEDVGMPVFNVEVEMKASPHLFRDEWKSFEAGLLADLTELNKELDRLLNEGKAKLNIVGLPPGSLSDDEIFIC